MSVLQLSKEVRRPEGKVIKLQALEMQRKPEFLGISEHLSRAVLVQIRRPAGDVQQ